MAETIKEKMKLSEYLEANFKLNEKTGTYKSADGLEIKSFELIAPTNAEVLPRCKITFVGGTSIRPYNSLDSPTEWNKVMNARIAGDKQFITKKMPLPLEELTSKKADSLAQTDKITSNIEKMNQERKNAMQNIDNKERKKERQKDTGF